MARVLIGYGSSEGQTAVIADRIGDQLEGSGHEAIVISTKRPPANINLANYDGVVVAASIHFGTHQDHAEAFVRRHVDVLNQRPSMFVSVSLTAAKPVPEAASETEQYVETFLETTGWEPDQTHVVAGALKYREYGLLTRLIMRRIAKKERLATDTSRNHEYTDWKHVERVTSAFEDVLEQRLGVEKRE